MKDFLRQLKTRLELQFRDLQRRGTDLETAVRGADALLDGPKRLGRQIEEAETRLDSIFTGPSSTFKPERDHPVSTLPEVQRLWQQGWDEAEQDTTDLTEAEDHWKQESEHTERAKANLGSQLARAREVHWQEPPADPDRRLRPWWERLWRAIRAGNWRLFSDKEELIEKEAAKQVDRFDAILKREPTPDARSFQRQLEIAQEALRELGRIQDSWEPRPPEPLHDQTHP
jgi:hypothetical protein